MSPEPPFVVVLCGGPYDGETVAVWGGPSIVLPDALYEWHDVPINKDSGPPWLCTAVYRPDPPRKEDQATEKPNPE